MKEWIPYQSNTTYQIKRLHYVEWWPTDTRPDTAFNAPASGLRAARVALRGAFRVADSSGAPLVVWVTRNGTKSRNVLNEHVAIEALRARLPHVEVTSWLGTEGMSHAAKRFGGASVVIGAHGAGLSNVIFCNSCTLVELALESAQMRYFAHLAMALELDYLAIPEMTHFRQNATINVERVVGAVVNILNSK